jgi:hypothetical protein
MPCYVLCQDTERGILALSVSALYSSAMATRCTALVRKCNYGASFVFCHLGMWHLIRRDPAVMSGEMWGDRRSFKTESGVHKMAKMHLKLLLLCQACYVPHSGGFLDLFFDIEYVGDVPPKRRFTFTGVPGRISQKIRRRGQ